jgi:hypothetical protein
MAWLFTTIQRGNPCVLPDGACDAVMEKKR